MKLSKLLVLSFFSLSVVSGFLFLNLETPPSSPVTVAPTQIKFKTRSGGLMDLGWKSLGMGIKIPFGVEITYNVSGCATLPDGRVGTCNISGPVDDPTVGDTKQLTRRCSNDTTKICVTNTDCASGGSCKYYLGGPLPLDIGGVSACNVTYFDSPQAGTVDFSTGNGTISSMPVVTKVYNGEISYRYPCPRCKHVSSDKKGWGRCEGGTLPNNVCQIHSYLSGDETGDSASGTSLDCPPSGGRLVGSDLSMNLGPMSTNFFNKQLSSSSPNQYGSTSKKVFVGYCSGTSKGCFTSADCGGSSCVAHADTRPNTCADGVCTLSGNTLRNIGSCQSLANSTQVTGQCYSTKDSYLDPKVCTEDSQCVNEYGAYGGPCTISVNKCIPGNGGLFTTTGTNEISVDGYTGSIKQYEIKTNIGLGSIFAVPKIAEAAVYSVVGLPGPGRLFIAVDMEAFPNSTPTPTPADTTGPVLTIDSPLDNSTVTTNTVTVRGTASDPSGVLVVWVARSGYTGNDTAATGTTSWSKEVTLNPGTNTIFVSADDKITPTNRTPKSITVTYSVTTPTPPPGTFVPCPSLPRSCTDMKALTFSLKYDSANHGSDGFRMLALPVAKDPAFSTSTLFGSDFVKSSANSISLCVYKDNALMIESHANGGAKSDKGKDLFKQKEKLLSFKSIKAPIQGIAAVKIADNKIDISGREGFSVIGGLPAVGSGLKAQVFSSYSNKCWSAPFKTTSASSSGFQAGAP